jgi:hypothetical protein
MKKAKYGKKEVAIIVSGRGINNGEELTIDYGKDFKIENCLCPHH